MYSGSPPSNWLTILFQQGTYSPVRGFRVDRKPLKREPSGAIVSSRGSTAAPSFGMLYLFCSGTDTLYYPTKELKQALQASTFGLPAVPESTDPYLRFLLSKTIPSMVFGTRVLEYWVLGPFRRSRPGASTSSWPSSQVSPDSDRTSNIRPAPGPVEATNRGRARGGLVFWAKRLYP